MWDAKVNWVSELMNVSNTYVYIYMVTPSAGVNFNRGPCGGHRVDWDSCPSTILQVVSYQGS